MSALLDMQRRFLGSLLEPLVGENRALAELPSGGVRPSGGFEAVADALLRSTPAVPARERLGLYQRQYWFRLLDSLAEDFPRVRALVGREAFPALLERFLLARPPACWTLRHLGADFAAFVRTDAALPPSVRPWAGDLADWEYAHMRVFEAARLPAPAAADFATRSLVLQPDVELVPVSRPISRLPLDAEPDGALLAAKPRRELHVVWRGSGHALRSRREPVALLPLLQSLRRGGALADLIARARPLPGPDLVEAAFARWLSLGWLALSPDPGRGLAEP